MVRWPGRGGDEGEEGKYSDVARAKPGPKPGTGATEQQVRRILARGGRMRPVEIARRLSEERDGPHVPFEGQHKRTVQHQVSHILRQMEDRGEAAYERRGRRESWWQLTVGGGPRGDPKPTGWTGGHAKAGEGRPENRRPRGGFGVLREPERHEPSNPVSAAEQRKKAEARRRRSDPTNPENWGSGRRDLADESERNQEVRERVRRREEERRRSDPTNPENWGRGKREGGDKKPSAGSLGIFGPATPPSESDDGGDDDGDDGGGLGIFKKV